MKIFNWVHRKLLPSVKYGQVSEKKDVFVVDQEKQDHFSDGMMEKEALLVHASLSSILTIGTLGHEEFISQFYCAQEDLLSVEEEDVVNVEAALEGNEVAPKSLSAIDSFKFEVPVEAEGQQSVTDRNTEEADKIQELPLLKEDKEKRERERITLADLLAADDLVVNDHPESGSKGANTRMKQHASACTRKKSQNYKKEGKWTSTISKANTNTTRKLQELIIKVLKKKIHPETEAVLPNAAELQLKERKEPLFPEEQNYRIATKSDA